MKILAINCGSSSLKFKVAEISTFPGEESNERCLLQGRIRLGAPGELKVRFENGGQHTEIIRAKQHDAAVRLLLATDRDDIITALRDADAVGHRIVHGGSRHDRPALMDEEMFRSLDQIGRLAPLHNRPALEAARAVRRYRPSLPMVAVFDTAFHRHLPEHARRYAIPDDVAHRHQIWRFGFHGLAHRWMVERYAALTGRSLDSVNLVTLQLGSGCSAAAIRNGEPVETSMGLTPLEGLMMATRCGDADLSLLQVLAEAEHASPEEVLRWLNTHCGLAGVSGNSGDVRALLHAELGGDSRAALALQMYSHRIRKYVGAYLATLNGAEAIVFGGGIGEHQPEIRARVCRDMDWCGLKLDEEQNRTGDAERCISKSESRLAAWVIPVDEETLIARDTARCLASLRESDIRRSVLAESRPAEAHGAALNREADPFNSHRNPAYAGH